MQQYGTDLHCVWQAAATLGEGPLWVERERALYWVDIKKMQLHRYGIAGGEQRSWQFDSPLSALAPRASGGFIGTFREGFATLDLRGDGAVVQTLGGPEAEIPENRFNDGKVDAQGNFWAGSMDDDEERPSGVLYRLGPDLQWQPVDDGYVITNGPAFSPDGRTLYHNDTLQRTVYAFDLDERGRPCNKRVFVQLSETSGYPDGLTVDSEGCIWLCHWSGWGITRFSPDAEAIGRIELPVANVTSCTFAGPQLDTLFITTARKGLSSEELQAQPLAGGLFRCHPGVRGMPQPLFGD